MTAYANNGELDVKHGEVVRRGQIICQGRVRPATPHRRSFILKSARARRRSIRRNISPGFKPRLIITKKAVQNFWTAFLCLAMILLRLVRRLAHVGVTARAAAEGWPFCRPRGLSGFCLRRATMVRALRLTFLPRANSAVASGGRLVRSAVGAGCASIRDRQRLPGQFFNRPQKMLFAIVAKARRRCPLRPARAVRADPVHIGLRNVGKARNSQHARRHQRQCRARQCRLRPEPWCVRP